MASDRFKSQLIQPPPRTLNVQKFAESRAPELESLHSIVSSRLNHDFRSRRNKRRRTTGYDDRVTKNRSRKRRKLGKIDEGRSSLAEKEGKKVSRRIRRRIEFKSNPALGFCVSGDGSKRLRTHVWHAKRFDMTKRWGFYLPLGLQGRGRGSRSVLKWLRNGALIHDASYNCAVQLEGTEESLLKVFRMVMVLPPSLSSEEPSNPVYRGVCYGNAMLHHVGAPISQLIAPVTFMWRPFSSVHIDIDVENDSNLNGHCMSEKSECSTSYRQLWVWIHAAAFSEGFGALRYACQELAARRFQSSKNLKYITDDIEVELNRIMHDVGKPLDGSSLDSLFNSATTDHLGYSRSTEFITRGCMPLDACDYSQYDFINEENFFCSNASEKNDQHWNDRLGFLDDNFLGERKYGVAEKNQPFQMDYDSSNSLRAANHEMYDYGFEDPCIANQRDRGKTWNDFDMSESPTPYLDPLTSRKDYSYIALDEERYRPAVHRNWDFRCTAKKSSWPFLATEDAMDTMSLLSEESCSSSAVRGGLTKKSASKLMKLKTGRKSHGSDLPKILEKNVNSLNKKEMMCENLGEVCQEKNLKGVGNSKNVPNFSSPRTCHFLKEFPAVQKISEPRHSFLVDEGYTSVHEELDMRPFHRTCMELNTTSLNCNVRTEDDLFRPFSITKSYPNPESSRKRSKFDAMGNHAPSACYFSEKDVAQQPVQPAHSYDSHIPSSIRSRLMKPDIQLASRTEGHPPHSSCVLDLQKGDEVPDVSRRYNVRKDEDELGYRLTDFREALKELPKGVSIENSDLSLGNGNTADVADFKDSCSELEEAKDENPEPMESPKTRNSPGHGEEIPFATKERPGKLEGCINAKQYNNDADVPVLLQSGNEEKEPSRAVNTKIGSEGHANGDPSYQVMLESYVLQLLCVQKVLKEASEPNNVKKVDGHHGWVTNPKSHAGCG